jgi:hypothetical protein
MSLRPLPLILGALALCAVLLLSMGTSSKADEGRSNHIVYLNVTGVGPNAKAWFHGAPPAGVQVQEALDRFAEQGYRVSAVRAYQRPMLTVISPEQEVIRETSERDEFFIILLEKN